MRYDLIFVIGLNILLIGFNIAGLLNYEKEYKIPAIFLILVSLALIVLSFYQYIEC